MDYAYKRAGSKSFGEVIGAVERSISAHGFAVEHMHDIQATLASKGFEIEPLRIYEITGRRTLLGDGMAEPGHPGYDKISHLMPCRINVFIEDEQVMVAAVRPTVVCRMFPEAELENLATALDAIVLELVDEAVA